MQNEGLGFMASMSLPEHTWFSVCESQITWPGSAWTLSCHEKSEMIPMQMMQSSNMAAEKGVLHLTSVAMLVLILSLTLHRF